MNRVSIRQKMVSGSDLAFPGFIRTPHDVKPTALALWVHTDVAGRRQLIPELIAADCYPGEAAVDKVLDHLLILAEAGFLTIYTAPDGTEWIQLSHPLKADSRTARVTSPPPPAAMGNHGVNARHDLSRQIVAVGGEGARARERAQEWASAESDARAREWARWEREQERGGAGRVPPRRPLLLDAPPIGCPDHPNGRYEDCGPCGTARRRHDRWMAEHRYLQQLEGIEVDSDESQSYTYEEPF